MKDMIKWNYLLMGTLLFSTMMVSCSEDEIDNSGDDQNETSVILPPQPTTDEILTMYHGKTYYGVTNDQWVENFMRPRTSNVTDFLDEDVQLVIVSEEYAETFLNDRALFSTIKSLWNKKRALAFINPGENVMSLLMKLRYNDFEYEPQLTSEQISIYSHAKLLLAQAPDNYYVKERYDIPKTIISHVVSETENGKVEEERLEHEHMPNVTDFHHGQVAEEACQWLNKYVSSDNSDVALVRTTRSGSNYTSQSVTTVEWSSNLYASYWQVSEYKHPSLQSRYVPQKLITSVTAGFDQQQDADIYDISVKCQISTSQMFNWNVCLDTYGLFDYKDKYTGYCLVGPSVQLSLRDSEYKPLPNSSVFSAVPKIENNDVTVTHYPAQVTLGGNLSVGVSSTGPEGSLGFSASGTLPYDATTVMTKELPFTCKIDNGCAEWEFYHSGYNIYSHTWGSNGRPNDGVVPSAAQNDTEFGYMATIKASESKGYGDQDLYLYVSYDDEVYSEYCDPGEREEYLEKIGSYGMFVLLPVVYRYFGEFRPSVYTSTIPITSSEWTSLNNALMGNPNYYALSDETISVGSRVETSSDGRSGVIVQAEKIWDETINSLVKQNNGHLYADGEWVIGLYGGTDNNDEAWLKKGIYIKGTEWKVVDNVEDYNLTPSN